ncbi:MAG: hypothetical protein V4710_18730, partial [Verrucomicrobiota bacterium]
AFFCSHSTSGKSTALTNAGDQEPASLQAGAAKLDFEQPFLAENEWDAGLNDLSDVALSMLVDAQPSEFWTTKPSGISAAYRLFGRLGRSDPASALAHSIELWKRAGVDGESKQNCLRWAVLGIIESHGAVDIDAALAQCPREFRRSFIHGAIGGRDSGSLMEDFQHFSELQSRLAPADKAASNDILRGVVEVWAERDPLATTAWLQSKAGEPYRDLLLKAISIAILGGFEGMLKQVTDSKIALPIEAVAGGFYQNGADANAIASFTAKLPEEIRVRFLAAYGKQLAAGAPAVLQAFVESADASLLIPEIAKSLAGPILKAAPRLFEKLTSGMAASERNRLLESAYIGQNAESSVLYLTHIGFGGVNANPALFIAAGKNLEKVIALIDSAPEGERQKLREQAYSSNLSRRLDDGAPLYELFEFAKSLPAEFTRSISESIINSLALKNPAQCIETLENYYPSDEKMWLTAFGGNEDQLMPNFNLERMSSILQRKMETGISPPVYAAVAQAMTAAYARENTDTARNAVEALTDAKVKAQCATELVKTWAIADPLSAAAYASQLPAGDGRDSAIAAVLPRLSFSPGDYEQLLTMISSERLRQSLREKAGEMNRVIAR